MRSHPSLQSASSELPVQLRSASESPAWLVGAFHSHLHPVHLFARGDEEQVPVGTAKSHVGGPRLWNRNIRQPSSRLIKDGHAFACEVNVAFSIDRHSVRSQFTEERLIRQAPVRIYGVRICLPRADIRHVH